MRKAYIRYLGESRHDRRIGTKASHLRFLLDKGFLIPRTHVCTWAAFSRRSEQGSPICREIRRELAAIVQPGRLYAVRSSANVEDSRDHSFAGQFRTVLNVQGLDDILWAIQQVWDSAHSAGARVYGVRAGNDRYQVMMAVIIQEMVQPAVVSGVAFSKNPLTGMDEVVVEAVRGSGEALVQEGVTPQRWINKWGRWISVPLERTIDQELIQQVVAGTREIAKAYRSAVDLEWVYDGRAVHWVQLREITSLQHVTVYSNRIAREMLPGVIKPLVWSVNVPLFSGLWLRLFEQVIGPSGIRVADLIKPFYGRAYVNMSAIGRLLEMLGLPREGFELMLGIEVEGDQKPRFRPSVRTWLLVPRMVVFALDKLRYGQRLDSTIAGLGARLRALLATGVEGMGEEEVLAAVEQLRALMEQVAYCNLLTQVLMYLHHGILKAQLKRLGFSVDNMDLRSTQEEPSARNLAIRLTELKRRFEELDEQTQERVRHGSYPQLLHLQGAGLLHQGVLRFMEDFGHLSDSESDFSATRWRENPDAVLRMIVDYVPRSQATGGLRRLEDLQVSPLRRLILRRLGEWARTYSRHRDAISYLFTSGIALLRRHFLVLAEQWVQQGILGCPDDIFYLDDGELRQVAEGGVLRTEAGKLVVGRRREAEAWRNASPRETLYGEQAPPLDTHVGQRLKGTPTSSGCYRGSVQVVRGIEEFHKVKAGDVLVIPYSDASWTPLFARAGAVVAESGGMLSHSSIVAREYRIPAVVSVQGACALRDGCIVTVDGYRGEVLIEEQGAGGEGPTATPRVPGPTDVGAQSEGSAAA